MTQVQERPQTRHSVVHASFVIERTLSAPPARVFRAFSDPAEKARWFVGNGDWTGERGMDFRVGGAEHLYGGQPDGPAGRFDARYYDIVPDERIVYAYEMHVGGVRLSVSVATIELEPVAGGTRLTITEQGAFLDGHEDGSEREHGTRILLDQLASSLGSAAVTA
jgi:uncharacterized protein YndB with AHSA1/START domain